MAIELMTVFKVRNLDANDAPTFADELEHALGDVLQEEKVAAVTAYFVAAAEGTNSLRVGMRFEDMKQEFLADTAKEMLDLAVQRVDQGRVTANSLQHELRRLSSQLVSA